MAVVVLTGGAGSPGVTTTCLALAAHWPAPAVIIEADPSGSSAVLAGRLRGTVPGLSGVLEAAVAMRSGCLSQAWPELLIGLPNCEARLLPALALPAQRRTMSHEWPQLGPALAELARSQGVDLLVDAGRLGGTGYAEALVRLADRVLLVSRSSLRSIHSTSVWSDDLARMTIDPSRLQVVVVGPGQPYPTRDLSKYLALEVVRELPLDPAGAAVYSDGAEPRRKRSALDTAVQKWAVDLHGSIRSQEVDFSTEQPRRVDNDSDCERQPTSRQPLDGLTSPVGAGV